MWKITLLIIFGFSAQAKAQNITALSSVTAGAFFGDGANINNMVIYQSSSVAGSFPLSTSEIFIATLTATLRGARPYLVHLIGNTNNSSGAARDYTMRITQDGNLLGENYISTTRSSDFTIMNIVESSSSSPAGTHTWSFGIKSSGAGTQSIINTQLTVTEY